MSYIWFCLDRCSIIQGRQSQKVHSVHLDSVFSLGETFHCSSETKEVTENTAYMLHKNKINFLGSLMSYYLILKTQRRPWILKKPTKIRQWQTMEVVEMMEQGLKLLWYFSNYLNTFCLLLAVFCFGHSIFQPEPQTEIPAQGASGTWNPSDAADEAVLWPWLCTCTSFQCCASRLFSICLSIYLFIRNAENCCRMDGMYLSCHTGSLITSPLCQQTCRQTAAKQRIPQRFSQTAPHSDNEPSLTSVHISAAISPVIIKLHRADGGIHINEGPCVPDLGELNVSALATEWCRTCTLITGDVVKTQISAERKWYRKLQSWFDLIVRWIKWHLLTFPWAEQRYSDASRLRFLFTHRQL